jgi:hypothetical protein
MRKITEGKDKGWCRCERCGSLLVPDAARYSAHLEDCDGTDHKFEPADVFTQVPEARQDDAVALQALQDRVCVYLEKHLVCLFRLVNIRTNRWGVQFAFEFVPAPGFEPRLRVWFKAGASWEYVHVSNRLVGGGAYVGWTLVTRPDLVERIMAAAAEGKVELRGYINDVLYEDVTRTPYDDAR